MPEESFRARSRTAAEIRAGGAIGSLRDGIEIPIHGVSTRLIAWPGNGFQTESVHLLTPPPGAESERYSRGMAEEALLCLKGAGEVFLRGRWVRVEAGDLSFHPPGTDRAVRNPAGSGAEMVVVSAASPPPFDLYAPAGFYDLEKGRMDDDRILEAVRSARVADLLPENEMHPTSRDADISAEALSNDEIRRGGALFNVFSGAKANVINAPMRFVLWPGYGIRSTGFHFAYHAPGPGGTLHTHPASDEGLIMFAGRSEAYCGDAWHSLEAFDCVMAPCGVVHGQSRSTEACWWGGFAAPPQLDLYARTEFYHSGRFDRPAFQVLDPAGA